jgi:phage FluMu gp28-like protein
MEKVQDHIRSCGIVARSEESSFFEGTSLKQLEVRFPNGSVIYGLPANPDTARGYSGNVTLDEFAFHADADKIYAALFPTITRGYGLEVISTPNGTQGKFYELARAAGLEERKLEVGNGKSGSPDFLLPTSYPRSELAWSAHWCDIYEAVRQGLKVDVRLLRSGCEDATAWQQEFCCQFVSIAENFFSPELLASSLSAEAGLGIRDSGFGNRELGIGKCVSANLKTRTPDPEYFLGIDIGRRHDRTVFWVDEVAPPEAAEFRGSADLQVGTCPPEGGRYSVARLVRTLENTPFDEQLRCARELLRLEDASGAPLIRRCAIDATGIGAHMAETLQREFGPRVEPVVFTAAVKEDLAFRTKHRMEAHLTLLPDTREIRRAFSAVKKFVTPSGNLRFDAARTEAGHADEFWAKALADLAADSQPVARATDGFLAPGAPLIRPSAFEVTDTAWAELDTM